MASVKTALTIAGSDPSGGAGIQADLKTFSRLGVYGTSVITALTAQNTSVVEGVMGIPPEFVGRQLDAVFSDIEIGAVKTGMLWSAGVVETVAQKMSQYCVRNLVVDPVFASTSGATLLESNAIETLVRTLIPLALMITPNRHEAEILTGSSIATHADMEQAAVRIQALGARFVLLKGGHMQGDEVTDVLFDGKSFLDFRAERVLTQNTHGTGCVLSAAITAELAAGKSVGEAVERGKLFVTEAIKRGISLGRGGGTCDPLAL